MGDRLRGKIAVVTGGASGIGEATVARFVEEGARVVSVDIQVERGRAAAEGYGGEVVFQPCDVTDEAQVAAAVRRAVEEFGRIDVMCNNAGVIGAVGPVAETEGDAWRSTIDVLLHSVFYGTKHAVREMMSVGRGSIINTSSIAGVIGGLGPHAYTTAKTAVVGFTRSVAAEIGPAGLRCNAIAPGAIPTPLTAMVTTGDPKDLRAVAVRQRELYGVEPEALDIANAALYLAGDEAKLVNGHTLVVDAGRSINGGSARFSSSAPGRLGGAGDAPSD